MVMPVGPMKFTCEKCGWSKVINQPTDVIMGPRTCPKCEGKVRAEMAGLLDRLLSPGSLMPGRRRW